MKRIITVFIATILFAVFLTPVSAFAAAPAYDIIFNRGTTQMRGGITATVSVSKSSGLREGDSVRITVSFTGTAASDGRFSLGFDHGGLIFPSQMAVEDWQISVKKGQTTFNNKTFNVTMPKKPSWDMGLSLSCAFIPILPTEAATVAPPSSTTEKITVATLYFPGLKITITNPHYYAGEIDAGTNRQIKFYFNKDTTFSFNKDVSIATSTLETAMSLSAGDYFKPYDYSTGAMETMVAAKKDGSYRFVEGSSYTFNGDETIYSVGFIDIMHYEPNIAEGYKMTDIREWKATADSTAAVASPPADITPEDIAKVQQRFDKWYTNKLLAVNATQGKNTVKTAIQGDLVFYSYDPVKNFYSSVAVEYAVDDGGVSFTAPASGIIIISEGKFTKESQ